MEALRPLSITAVPALLRAPPVPIPTFVGTGREVGGRRGKSVRAGAGGAGWLSGLLGRKGGGGAPMAMTVTPGTVKAGDPVLHEPAQEVSPGDVPSEKIQGVIDQMIAVMRKAPGVGLAAPQIGVPLKIIVLEDTQEYISYASKEDIDAQDRRSFDLLVARLLSIPSLGRRVKELHVSMKDVLVSMDIERLLSVIWMLRFRVWTEMDIP
ncbi:peptide deformylase 1A, chloroplastic isoform X2 [Triticum aestivum]|uniref:peptide deformylase 1A, chloroplastic isoform X2 n=1 Tax=Triticum aestivum TaxID=4565 RepID=UPI001D02BF35|nr:peptide deformylase 1A, chloroplastic-like isoform X2 [Triticum aestivum]